MKECRNIAECIQAEQDSIAYYDCRIIAWTNAIVKTKKDGTEFAELSNRCIEGAKIVGDELQVFFKNEKGAYDSDYIKIYGFCDELPTEDERSIDRKTQGFVRAKYTYTPQEMREQIVKAIENYCKWKYECEQAKVYLESIQEDFEKDIEMLKAKYLTNAKELRNSVRWHTADAIKNYWLGYNR